MTADQVTTTKITKAAGAQCETCGQRMGNCHPYWPLAKQVAMHRRGCPDHRVILWRWAT